MVTETAKVGKNAIKLLKLSIYLIFCLEENFKRCILKNVANSIEVKHDIKL